MAIARPFAVSKFTVTFDEWAACAAGGGCKSNPTPSDEGWGKGRQPVINLSWDDAMEYVTWLSQSTGKTYRLLSEAEWEYAARAGTTSPFSTGQKITSDQANFQTPLKDDDSGNRDGEYREQAVKVGSFPANPWGLHDVHGNVRQWVHDVWREDYTGAPIDGSARLGEESSPHVLRGGSWYSFATDIRSASRHKDLSDYRSAEIGFRIARDL
jgi:formylglycine-generating enzyme required for sulfatase activity